MCTRLGRQRGFFHNVKALLAVLFIVLALGVLAGGAHGAELYVAINSNSSPNHVERFDLTTGADLGTFAYTGSNYPWGLAFDRTGNLYVAYENPSFTINRFSPTGANLGTFASTGGSSYPFGLAFDKSGNLYVANSWVNTIDEFSPTGASLGTFASGLNGPSGLAFDKSGNLYVTNLRGNTISEFSPTGASLGTFATVGSPLGIAFDGSGNLYVTNGLDFTIPEFSPSGTALGTFASGLDNPTGLAFDSSGYLYVANTSGNNISEFSPTGTPLGTFTSFSSDQLPTFIAIGNVPEPSLAILAVLGLAGGAFGRRIGRRRKGN